MGRKARYPTITKQADGLWHAWVTVGKKPTGKDDRRHVKRGTYDEARAAVDELLGQVQTSTVLKPGRKPTVEGWLTTYLDSVAPRRCDPGTVRDYRSLCRHWVYPDHGSTRIDRLTPDDLDSIYLGMARAGKADSTVLKMHRVLNRALKVAQRRKLVAQNVAQLIDPPTAREIEIDPLTEAEAGSTLDAAVGRRNSARWSIGLALGLRQGEVLGLRWAYLDLDAGEMRVWWQLRRRSFEHGCGEEPCGRRRGGNCPRRHLPMRTGEQVIEGGLVLKPPKGKSKRTIPLPPELVGLLRAHREIQELEQVMAEGAWQNHDLVFARLDGGPIDPAVDYDEWHALLAAAGLPPAGVHAGRHTAATIMRMLGVEAEVVQELLGHSDIRVTRRYTHVASEMAKKATERMGSALLGKRSAP